ncbi:MAG TPA: MFS transporter, partial [Blastocatellia bacterium]|nr:MFS transporter [Blastocatellia bacterium]
SHRNRERNLARLMGKSRSPLIIIFITIFIDLVGFGIVIPVLPLYARQFGASETTIGILVAIYSVMQFIAAPLLGKLSDRVGRRPVLLFSLIGTSLGFLLMGVANTLALLFIARIIDGITGGNIATAQAYIADVTSPEERSKGMGLIGAAFGLGFTIGPVIGGLMSQISPGAPFLFAAGLAAANATALFFLLPESLRPEHRAAARGRSSFFELLQESENRTFGIAVATYFVATVAFAALTMTYALFANQRYGFDALHTGYMFAYLGLLGAVIQGGLLGRLVKMFGDKTLVITGTVLFAVSMFLLPLGSSTVALILASGGIAIGNSLMTPTLNGLASKSMGPAMQGRVLGVMSSGASLARIIGPVLGGWLLSRDAASRDPRYGITPYWVSGSIMLVALALAITLPSSQPQRESDFRPPIEEK